MNTQRQEPRRGTAKADTPAVHPDATDTRPLFDDRESTMKGATPFDTTALVGAKFHRPVILTNGTLAAEFLPWDVARSRLVLDEDAIETASLLMPELNPELRVAIAAIGRMRRRVGRG